MKKLFYFLFAALIFVACDKDAGVTDGPNQDIETEIVSLSQKTMALKEGQSVLLTLETRLTDFATEWLSSDTAIVKINVIDDERCEVIGKAEGTAFVYAQVASGDQVYTAQCKIMIDAFLGALKFDVCDFFMPDLVRYSIKMFDTETNDSVDVPCFKITWGILSDAMYLNNEGAVVGGDGICILAETAGVYDDNNTPNDEKDDGMICLGDYQFSADSAYNDKGQLIPFNVAIGRFNDKIYSKYLTQLFDTTLTEAPDPNAFPFFEEGYSALINCLKVDEGPLAQFPGGYPYGGYFSVDINEERTKTFVTTYKFETKLMDNKYNFGLELEPIIDEETGDTLKEDGQIVYDVVDKDGDGNYDLAPMFDYTFERDSSELETVSAAPVMRNLAKFGNHGSIKLSTFKKMAAINRMKNVAIISKYNILNRKK